MRRSIAVLIRNRSKINILSRGKIRCDMQNRDPPAKSLLRTLRLHRHFLLIPIISVYSVAVRL
jgi:hypothetical protein